MNPLHISRILSIFVVLANPLYRLEGFRPQFFEFSKFSQGKIHRPFHKVSIFVSDVRDATNVVVKLELDGEPQVETIGEAIDPSTVRQSKISFVFHDDATMMVKNNGGKESMLMATMVGVGGRAREAMAIMRKGKEV